MAATTVTAPAAKLRNNRWMQLLFGIICMVMVANLQLGWTPFVDPIDQKYHWGRYAIQWAFTIFVLTLRRPPFVRLPGGGIKLGSFTVKPPVSVVAAFSVFSGELWKSI